MISKIRFESVSKVYQIAGKRKVQALNNVTFCIEEGEFVAVVGESGCGKSTIGRLILGSEKADQGSVWYEEKEIKEFIKEKSRDFYFQVQSIQQEPYLALSPRMKIRTYLQEPLVYMQRLSRKEANTIIEEVIKQVQLSPECLDRYPHQVSGGQLQRVVIARTLLIKPKFLFCDEPTSALDVSVQNGIAELIMKMKGKGVTCLLVTHDLLIARKMCDRFLVIYKGVLVEEFGKEHWNDFHHPYTELLLSSIIGIDEKDERSIDRKKEMEVKARGKQENRGCVFCARCPAAQDVCQSGVPPFFYIEEKHKCRCFLAEKLTDREA